MDNLKKGMIHTIRVYGTSIIETIYQTKPPCRTMWKIELLQKAMELYYDYIGYIKNLKRYNYIQKELKEFKQEFGRYM